MDLPLEALPPALVDPARRAWQALCEADRDCVAATPCVHRRYLAAAVFGLQSLPIRTDATQTQS